MDSITYRNEYVKAMAFNKVDILITLKKKLIGQYVYTVVCKATEKECEQMKKEKKLTDSIINKLKEKKLIESIEEIKIVSFIGELKIVKDLEKLVYAFPLRTRDIINRKDQQYRFYTITLEQQKENMCYVNLCNNAKDSWKSVIDKVGSEFGVVLKIKTNGNINS